MPRGYVRSGKYTILRNNSNIKCELCGHECKNIKSLEAHLRTAHKFGHEIAKYEDYYNRYLKQDGDGICIVCGKPTAQHKFKYDKCCSRTCAAVYAQSRRKICSIPEKYKEYDRYFKRQIADGLHIDISEQEILSELIKFQSLPGSLSTQVNMNRTVLYFQQDEFYREEKKMFSENPEIRHRLIENREKYLFKSYDKLTDAEILRGFKISGVHQSYSHFSPLWTKWFAEQYNLKYVADPFGGWGHHMLGFTAAGCRYVYNDLSHNVVENVRRMTAFIGADTEIHEGDARDFKIPEECDGVFMCPPYFNLEIYECGAFESREQYDDLMVGVLKNAMSSNAKVVGVIIREDFEYLIDNTLRTYEKHEVNNMKSHFSKSGKLKEYFYIWRNPTK